MNAAEPKHSVLRRLSKRRRSAQTVKTLPRTKWAGASPELLPVHPMQPGLTVCRRGKSREASNGFFGRGLKSNGKYGIIETSRSGEYAVPGDRNRPEICTLSQTAVRRILMSEEYGNDFITLTDEEGNEVELEHLDTLEYEGETYMAFVQANDTPEEVLDEDSAELIILKVEPEDGEDMLVTIDDDDLLDTIFNLFVERLEAEDEGGEDVDFSDDEA